MVVDTKESGFTLIELLVTMVVVGLMIIGVSNIYTTISATQRANVYLDTATRAGQTEIESLRNVNYTSLVDNSTIDFSSQLPSILPKPRTATVVVSSPATDVKRVDVTITYRISATQQHTLKLSSLIGVLGIGK